MSAAEYYTDDAVFHVNGRSRFAGEHQGFSGFVEMYSTLMSGVDSYRLLPPGGARRHRW